MKKQIITLALAALMTAVIFVYSKEVLQGVYVGIVLCGQVVIPSLFPFLSVCSFLMRSGILSLFDRICTRPAKALFRLPACALPVFLLSLVAGYPVGAKLANTLYQNGMLTRRQGQKLALFSCSAGPAFLVLAVGRGMLQNAIYGYLLLAAHLLSSILTALICGRLYRTDDATEYSSSQSSSLPLTDALVLGIGDASGSMLTICAFTVLFSGLCGAIQRLPETLSAPLLGILEVSCGCSMLAPIGSAPLIAAICGFGGVSVICQCMACADKCRPNIIAVLLVRGAHAICSFNIMNLLIKLFPQSVAVTATFSEAIPKSSAVSIGFSFALLGLCVVFLCCCTKYHKRKISELF